MRTEATGAAAPLALLACAGPLPKEVAAAARDGGRQVIIAAVEGSAGDWVSDYPHRVVSIGQVGRMLATWRGAGCRDLVIAGAMRRPNLLRIRIDGGALRALRTVLSLTRGGDDSILRRIIAFFEREGFRVLGPHDVAPHLLAADGPLGRRGPTEQEAQAVVSASAAIVDLGCFDMGQAAVADPSRLIAMESVHGTDAMLRGLGTAPPGSVRVLVKLPKPGQEMRIDLPTIGPETVRHAAACGLAGIAVAAGQSLVMDREEVIRRADETGLFVVGIAPRAQGARARAATAPVAITSLNGAVPRTAEMRDIALGVGVLRVASAHLGADQVTQGVVVTGEHVLTFNAALPLSQCVRGLGRSSQWGLRLVRRKIGALTVTTAGMSADGAADLAEACEVAGLAGVALVGDLADGATRALTTETSRRKQFLVRAVERLP